MDELYLVHGKVTEKIIMKTVSKHKKDQTMAETTHHGFEKGETCLTKLIAFSDEMTSFMDEGRPVNIFLNFSKAFNTYSSLGHAEYILCLC